MLRAFLLLLALVLVVWTVGTAFTQVESHQRAVIRRFGRILENKPEPGLHIGWPWGIDRVDLVPVGRFRTITVGFDGTDEKEDDVVPPGQMLTGDHNLVNVQASINYKIREDEPERYALQAHNVDAFVARAADSLLAEWIGGRKIDDVLRRGKADLPRFLQIHLQELLQKYELGIDIEKVSIMRLDPPYQVKEAFDRLANAHNSIETKVNQATSDADKRRSNTEAEKFKLERSALAYAREERIKAIAEADSFQRRLAQYRELSAKNVDYLDAVWLDQMTRIFAQLKDGGRIDLLDHYLTGDLSITQFPLTPKKK